MRLVRLLLALAFCAAAAAAGYRYCLVRYQCNVEQKIVDTRLRQVFDEPTSDWVRISTGRATAEQLQRCIANNPADYQLVELLGLAQRAADMPEAALATYQSALDLNERPQTYVAIASLYFELRQPDLAYKSLLRAAMFSPAYQWTYYPNLSQQLGRDVEARAQRIRAEAARK